jgi:nucleoside-diphosphate-sugar epimerase
MKIYIAGSSSFIGSNLIPYLESNNNYLLDTTNYRTNHNQIDLNNFDVIVNLIGKAHYKSNKSDYDDYFKINYLITKELFDKFIISNTKTFIHISSIKAVKDYTNKILTEDDLPEPTTNYGLTKLLAEQYILTNTPPGKRVFILRPTMVHGKNNKGNFNLMYKYIKKTYFWPLGSNNIKKSYCSVENLNFVIKELIDNKNISSDVFNVCDDEPLTLNEVLKIFSKTLNLRILFLSIPSFVINPLLYSLNYFHLFSLYDIIKKLYTNYIVSNKKIVTKMNKKLPVNAIDGLATTFNSFKYIE